MNYGWPMNRKREKKREVHALCFFSSFWVMEVSRCECCHADGDPGVLQKGRGARGELKTEKTQEGKKNEMEMETGDCFCFVFVFIK